MEMEHLRFLLRETGEKMQRLAKVLADEGAELNRDDQELVRLVKYQHLQRLLQEASMFWLTGNMEDFHTGLEQAHNL